MESHKLFAVIHCSFKNIWNKIMKITRENKIARESKSVSWCLLEKPTVAVIQGAF